MATTIHLVHRGSGLRKVAYYGFSWTTFFFGLFPALFRGDFLTFIGGCIVVLLIGVVTVGVGAWIAVVVWAFFYNKYHARRLIERGYVIVGSDDEIARAQAAIGIS